MNVDQYAEAYMQSMIASRNPMNKIVMSSMESETAKADLDLDKDRIAFIKSLRVDLEQAKQSGEDSSVVEGYRRLIEKHSAKSR